MPKPPRPRRTRTRPPAPQRLPEGDVPSLLRVLTARHRRSVVHVEKLPERPAVHGEMPGLPPALAAALGDGFRPYSHQADAVAAVRRGENVVTATGTASGKTLCYNLPVLESVLADPEARSLYLFPTKALAQDQLRALGSLAGKAGLDPGIATYDADTPEEERRRIKYADRPRILLTNPDMLHAILPWHGQWAWLWRNLRHVVLDEVHAYRGVFGSHVANVLRRLRRIAASYGGHPKFIASSATIANARELCERLVGAPFTLVDKDGSPRGPRTFVFWNPPIIGMEKEAPVRRKAFVDSADLFALHVQHGVRTLDFARSRRITERIYRSVREQLETHDPHLAARVSPYRGGYLAQDRREIESRLFAGDLIGVVTTNALELGIDVGGLDACILTAYPGTVASLWQQAGRAGRSKRESVVTLIADDDALNQYWMNHPQELLGRPNEHAIVDPDNPYVLEAHAACALRELPGSADLDALLGPAFPAARERLRAAGKVEPAGPHWRWTGPEDPHRAMGLRNVNADRYRVVDGRGRTLEEVDGARAFSDLHPGAIYYHFGDTYVVDDLDLKAKRATVREADVAYHTEPLVETDVRIEAEERRRRHGSFRLSFGKVRITQRVVGYVRIEEAGSRVAGNYALDLPEATLPTKALWYTVPEDLERALAAAEEDLPGAIHAAEHAMIGMLPLLAMCDRWDVGGVSFPEYPGLRLDPAVFIYDGYPGGVGLAAKAHELFPDLARITRAAVRDCPCKLGCPACIQSPKCGNRNRPLDKAGALRVLTALDAASGSAPPPA